VFNGKRILSVRAIEAMQANQVEDAKINKGEFVEKARSSSKKDIYGLGEWREETDKQGKAILISSPSWAGAYPWIDKKNHIYGFLLTHIARSKNGFNSFLASQVLAIMTRAVIEQSVFKSR